MNKEFETKLSERERELLVICKYARQEDLSPDDIFDSLEIRVPQEIYDDEFDRFEDQVYFDMVTGFYSSMPKGHPRTESVRLVNVLFQQKNRMIADSERWDSHSLKVIDEMSSESLSRFIAWQHGRVLGQALEEFNENYISDVMVTKLVLWSRLDKIGRKAKDIFRVVDLDLV